jgi:hypothetical protein
MFEAGKEKTQESSSQHEWKSLEGKSVESTSTFPPFKGIILEDGGKQAIYVPLMLAYEVAQLYGLEKKVQFVCEQVNWTNTFLRGMDTHTFVTNDYARKEHIIDLQVSTNTIVHSVNQLNSRVTYITDCVEMTQELVK